MEGSKLSDVSQKERDRVITLICGIEKNIVRLLNPCYGDWITVRCLLES